MNKKKKSILTDYTDNCLLCGRPTTEMHHLCFNRANRRLSDQDGLIMPLCRDCHAFIHQNGRAATMSKIIGQLAWERWYIGDFGDADGTLETARIGFRKKYGQSYV